MQKHVVLVTHFSAVATLPYEMQKS